MRKRRNMKLRVKNLVEKYNTSNPYTLCEKLNIEIRYFYYEGIKGFFRRILKRKYIVINEKLDEYSKLVVLCHELGHAIYHSSKNKLLMKINFFNYNSELENEANEFAAELMKYQEEVSYEVAKNCDLGLQVLEEMKRYIK
nr:MAG TPA: IrrE protein [Caudoviricetes sp.]